MKTRRTFKKSKHRKKRPYHKKVTISYLRLAKSTIIGVIPLIIICIGLTTSILINSKLLDRYNNLQIHIAFPEYTLPKVYIPNVIQISSNFLQKMIAITATIRITPPKMTLPTIKISLPQIDTRPFFTLLNPLPVLQSIGSWASLALTDEGNIFTKNIIQTFTIVGTVFLAIFTTVQQAIIGIYLIVTTVTTAIVHSIQNTLVLIGSFANSLVQQAQSTIALMLKVIKDFYIFCIGQLEKFLTSLWGEIKLLTNILWRIITLPFIAIQKELQTISPHVKAFATFLAKPINEFTQSINNLVALIAAVSKHKAT